MLATAKSDGDLAAHTFQTVTLPNGKGNLFDNVAFHGNVLEVKDADGTVLIYRQADGDLIFTSDLWNNEYYRNLEMHLRDFAALTTNDHRAFIEYWGEGTYRWTNWDLRATFRTD